METNICINCNNSFKGRYCNRCGQKVFTNKDKSVTAIAEEAFHFATHFEGKFFTTMRTVLTRPGKLSRDYCNGIRQRHYKPISFFLMLIIIYLLFPFMDGLNMKLEYYRGVDVTGEFITQQIDSKIAAMNITENQLADIFRQKSAKTAKILLLILIPLSATALFVLFYRSRKRVYDYMILATEINIFVLLVIFLILPYTLGTILFFANIQSIEEAFLLPVMVVILVIALFSMFRTFFRDSLLWTILKVVAFIFLYYVITQIIYKTLLFEITFMLI